MTRVLPTLPTDLTKADKHDLLTYLNTKLAEQEEKGADDYYFDEMLSEITTELLRREEYGLEE